MSSIDKRFFCFPVRGWEWVCVSSKAVQKVLDMKYNSEFKHGFTNPTAVAWRCLVKKVFLKIPRNSQENTCIRVSFLIKLKRLWHNCFLVNFAKFLGTTFFIEHLQWLLLLIVTICTVLFCNISFTCFSGKKRP